MLLLVPVILFMLGLPNKGPSVGPPIDVHADFTQEATGYGRLVALGDEPLSMLALAGALHQEAPEGDVTALDFKALEETASNRGRREFWKDKTIVVRGQYSPDRANDRVFSLVRFRIGCCAADAIRLDVGIVCKEPVKNIAKEAWVKVTGKLNFVERNGSYTTLVLVPSRSKIEPSSPDLNPWVQ